MDCAEAGRSGSPFARRWAAIASRIDGRVPTAGRGLVLATLETDDAREPLFGLLTSFSNPLRILSSTLAKNLGWSVGLIHSFRLYIPITVIWPDGSKGPERVPCVLSDLWVGVLKALLQTLLNSIHSILVLQD
jgi:hypothetical protein